MTGPIAGETFSEVMVPMGTNTDAWIAGVASYIRSAFGNAGGMVTPADVARVRAATTARRTAWTLADVQPTLPRRLENQSAWKITASHNPAELGFALTSRGWSTGTPQAAGMYFQIELPAQVMLTELEFDSPIPTTGRLGGRGAAAPAPMFPRLQVRGLARWHSDPKPSPKAGATARTMVTFAGGAGSSTPRPTVAGANWSIGNVKLYGRCRLRDSDDSQVLGF